MHHLRLASMVPLTLALAGSGGCYAADLRGDGASDQGEGDPDEGGPASGGVNMGEDGGDEGAGGSDGDGEHEPPAEDPEEQPPVEEPECDAEAPVTLFLSPDDSNSMSSPVQVREAVLSGWSSLDAAPIRTWEFLNYYTFDYAPAEPGQVALVTELHRDAETPEGEFVLQIAVTSEAMTVAARPPVNLTLVVDTSGSMEGHSIEMVREVGRAIAASLREGDVVSMVTWNTENSIELAGYRVSGPDDATLLDKIEALDSDGATDLHSGLVAGYELANDAFTPDRINRMILLSDGGANTGVTDIELIAAHAGSQDQDGIYMVGVGVGDASTYQDDLMDSVTDAGKGASVFIASAEEAWKTFDEQFVNTLAVSARDVQVKLDLPPGFEIVRFSGEEYSEDPSEIEPQHLSPNDTMVFHQKIATCATDLLDEDASLTVTARYKDVSTFEEHEVTQTIRFADLLAQQSPQLLKGAAVFEYAESLKAYREGTVEQPLEPAFAALARAEAALPGDTDLAEIRSVLEAL